MTAVLHAVPDALTSPDLDRLTTLERVIDRGVATFVEVGLALAEIRDRQLFRVTHPSFKAYVEDRWGFGQQWAYGNMYSAQVAQAIISVHGPLPAGITLEALRPLHMVLNRRGPEAVAQVWGDVTALQAGCWRPPSREQVRAVVAKAGLPTCAPGKPKKTPEIFTIGESMDRA